MYFYVYLYYVFSCLCLYVRTHVLIVLLHIYLCIHILTDFLIYLFIQSHHDSLICLIVLFYLCIY